MTQTVFIDDILSLTRTLPRERPLVHMIPNGVSAAFCADVMSAAGARPIMASSPLEAAEITSHAAALAANMGQPSEEKEKALFASLSAAAERGLPAVFDPVGAGASEYRRCTAQKLVAIPWTGIIKGNAAELHTLLTGSLVHQGVDSAGFSAEALALPTNGLLYGPADRVIAVTGSVDRILCRRQTDSDPAHILEARLVHAEKNPYTIVGTGCAAGALCACFAAVTDDRFLAALTALSLSAFAQSQAADCFARASASKSPSMGYGTFKELVLNAFSEGDCSVFQNWLEQHLIIITGETT